MLESALLLMEIWHLKLLKSKSASILFVKATDTHTNDVKVLHETFVMKVMGSRANNTKVLHETFVVKVTDSHANNAKTLHETFFVEVTDSNPVWEQTQQ